MSEPHKADDKLDYVNAIRGWAVLLVITGHVGEAIVELPYPIRKLTNFGWFGVQLFFLASAFTLARSWHRDSKPFGVKSRDFFIRRFFRIAPLYYLGALLYFVDRPPAGGLDVSQLLLSLGFINSWYPPWVPTTPGGWMVVPGGWSISTEFTFYFLFPLIATVVSSLWRAGAFFVVALIAAVFLNAWIEPAYAATFGWTPTNNYLYFWFFNQLPVFAIGFGVYFALERWRQKQLPARVSYAAAAALIVAMLLVAEFYSSKPHYIHSFIDWPPMLIGAVLFAALFLVMARGPTGVLNHRIVQLVGTLSFSVYLLQFIVIEKYARLVVAVLGHQPTGFGAIGACAVLWILVTLTTVALSKLTYEFIEEPGNALARRLIRRLAR